MINSYATSDATIVLENANAVLAAKGRSFYWAKHLLGTKHGARAARLYAFCRYIDDLADEAISVDMAMEALENVAKSIENGISSDPIIKDMLRLLAECKIDPIIPLELIKGVTSDLDSVRVPDQASLLRYCYRVAGTVGLMMCGVLDVDDNAAFPYAIDLGIAMQLTNICRDVAEDAQNNRRYLPASMLGDVDPAVLINPIGVTATQSKNCVASLLELADQYYKSGEAGLAYLPMGARSGILVAARVYNAIGTVLQGQKYSYWTQRAVVSKVKKTTLTARALLSFTINRSLWSPQQSHKSQLHSALSGLPGIVSIEGVNYAKSL